MHTAFAKNFAKALSIWCFSQIKFSHSFWGEIWKHSLEFILQTHCFSVFRHAKTLFSQCGENVCFVLETTALRLSMTLYFHFSKRIEIMNRWKQGSNQIPISFFLRKHQYSSENVCGQMSLYTGILSLAQFSTKKIKQLFWSKIGNCRRRF